jgi:uncharacterized membrane-anchored protein YjiN (DUF445 family)
MRKNFDAYLGELEVRLRDDPEMEAQAERLKTTILRGSELDAVVAAAWSVFKGRLEREPDRGDEPTSARLADIVARVATGILDEPQIVERFNERICDAAESVLVRYQQQFSLLITEIVHRWDAAEISEKIETELGPDLQYIRLNGSLVGGAAGVVLHAALVVTGAAA